jgi:dephospho-CoA kinase
MLKVAVTGNIGSGKSTVTRIFNTLGIPVFEADREAKKLYLEKEVIEEVKKHFGNDIYSAAGLLNKQKLADIIFNDENALATINRIIHPRTLAKYHEWLNNHTDCKYTIHESAILFENNLQHHFDKVITVYAPLQTRLKRVILRDGIAKNIILKRMKNQLDDDKKNSQADFVISNDGSEFLIPQVVNIDKKLKSL